MVLVVGSVEALVVDFADSLSSEALARLVAKRVVATRECLCMYRYYHLFRSNYWVYG